MSAASAASAFSADETESGVCADETLGQRVRRVRDPARSAWVRARAFSLRASVLGARCRPCASPDRV
jgi:hypothetical protein